MVTITSWAAVAGMILIVMFTAYEVFSRKIMNQPTIWTNELTGSLLIWVGLLGIFYAYDKRAHVSVDMVYSHLPVSVRAFSDVVTTAFIFLFSLCVCYFGYKYAWMAYSRGWRHQGMLDIPMIYTRIALPVVGGMLVFQVLIDLHDRISIFVRTMRRSKTGTN
jgi:TRAP-type C4-dicarboxylate transport system permease small subunit